MTLLDSIYLKAAALKIPLVALLELTQRCNESCIHCYIKGSRDKFSFSHDENELSKEQIIKLLGELAEEGALNLVFTGGEALLREDFFEIAQAAKERNFAITLFSNGQVIDEYCADKLAQVMPVCVYFSLYAKDSFTHDKITQLPGSFEKVLNAIRLLSERKINTGLKTIVMKNNIRQLKAIFTLGKSLGVARHEFAEEITAKIDGSGQPKACQLDDSFLYTYYKGDVPVSAQRIEELPLNEAVKKPLCGAGVFGVCVSSCGDVYPCAEWRSPLGNIKYQPFKEIWHNEAGLLGELRSAKEFADLPDCQKCSLVNFCRRCPGRAFAEEGRWRACYKNAQQRAILAEKVNKELIAKEAG